MLKAVYPRCHKEHEQTEACKHPKFCINCTSYEHCSTDSVCPLWKRKEAIIEIAMNQKISFTEAETKLSQNTHQQWRNDAERHNDAAPETKTAEFNAEI